MPFRVNEIQPTPNPNAAKFVLDRTISRESLSFLEAAGAEGHPIARKLFAIPGVSSVLFCDDFVTVNKRDDADWRGIRDRVKKVLAEA